MNNPFSRTTLWVVIGVSVASLVVAVALTLFGEQLKGGEPSAGTDTYSVSAIGHHGLVKLLEALDVPVVRSKSNSAGKARQGLLVILEPTVSDEQSKQRLRDLVAGSPRVLLVLPKWFGRAERGAAWIEEAELLPAREPQAVLDALGLEARVEHTGGARDRPRIREPQLVVTEHLEAEIADERDRALVVTTERAGKAITVLGDPDVLNNHGLRHPENARFTVELLDELRQGGPVVIDEVVHGYAQTPSLIRTLFEFPLVLATLQVLICALLAIWAAMVRFGPRRAAPPPLAPGKDFLIQNTAALLHYGGHHADALRRYLAHSVATVRHALHAPSLTPTAITAWLEAVRRARGGTVSLVDLERDARTADTPQLTLEVADRVYRWRMEMMHGSGKRS